MPDFSILLPSAEGKQSGGNPLAPDMFDLRASGTFNFFRELNPERKKLMRALQAAVEQGEDLEALFGVKGEALEQAVDASRALFGAPLMAALERYSPGVMYTAMDFPGLPTGAQRRLLEHAIIFSGLFGLLRPDDLIPLYKLRMEATLPEVGKVSKYWRPILSPVLNQAVRGLCVWNLLPAAHQEAWDDTHTYAQMIRVQFAREEGGERRSVSHGIKPLRGQLVNYLVRDGAESIDALQEWRAPDGYRMDEAATEHDEATRTTTVTYVRQG